MRRAAGQASWEIGRVARVGDHNRPFGIDPVGTRSSVCWSSVHEPANVTYGVWRWSPWTNSTSGRRRSPSPRPAQSPTGASPPPWAGRAEPSHGVRRARSVTSRFMESLLGHESSQLIPRCHISNDGICSEGDTRGCSILTTARDDPRRAQISGAPLRGAHSRECVLGEVKRCREASKAQNDDRAPHGAGLRLNRSGQRSRGNCALAARRCTR